MIEESDEKRRHDEKKKPYSWPYYYYYCQLHTFACSSFFSASFFFLFTLILLSHSLIQLLHIRSSTKINIHLRTDDAAQISCLFVHHNVLSRHQMSSFLILFFALMDNDNDRILSLFILFKQTRIKIQFDENEYTNVNESVCVCVCVCIRISSNRHMLDVPTDISRFCSHIRLFTQGWQIFPQLLC